jgi:hypothetical protein
MRVRRLVDFSIEVISLSAFPVTLSEWIYDLWRSD